MAMRSNAGFFELPYNKISCYVLHIDHTLLDVYIYYDEIYNLHVFICDKEVECIGINYSNTGISSNTFNLPNHKMAHV